MDSKNILPFEEEVNKIIAQLEEENAEHNIRFIYVVATGSRLNQTYNEQSNLNIRGFYVGSKESYLSVMRPPKELKINKDVKKQNATNFFIDYEFVDIKRYLYSTTFPDKQTNDMNFWFQSNIVYLNQIDPEIFSFIKSSCSFPQAAVVGRLIQYSKVFPNQTELNVREVYYALVTAIQAYFYLLHGKQRLKFPDNNLFLVLNQIKIEFPEQHNLATVFETLLKKYVDLKQKQIKVSNKEEDEIKFIEYIVQVVDKNKPLQKRQAELLEKDLKPQIVDSVCNELFKKIFSSHDTYKKISSKDI